MMNPTSLRKVCKLYVFVKFDSVNHSYLYSKHDSHRDKGLVYDTVYTFKNEYLSLTDNFEAVAE